MRKSVFYALTGLFALQLYSGTIFFSGQGTAYAKDDWKQEFAEVCRKTQNAMDLTPEELQGYIDRCNNLESRIQGLNGSHVSEKKVYTKRLKMCKDLYVYTLEFREKEE